MEQGVYLVRRNDNTRLLEYGFVEGSPILFQLELNGIFVFDVKGSRIGIRKEDKDQMELLFLGALNN